MIERACRRRLLGVRNHSTLTPSVAELDALTGNRDRVVDLIRLTSLIVVIAGHSLMLTVSVDDGRLVLGNTLADVPLLQPMTWLFQILPLFFFAGAAASTYGWRPGTRPGHWLLRRVQRLLRPVGWYLVVVLVVYGVSTLVSAAAIADVVARLGVQLLWFLGAYLLVLAVMPMLQRLSSRRAVLSALAAAWLVTAVVDSLRIAVGASSQIGYVNFLSVWIIPAILGVAYAKRLFTMVEAAVLCVTALVVDIALVALGPYEMSLVTVPGQQLSNMSPPSLLLAGHTVVLCALVIALRAPLARVAARPRVWWWVVLGNRGAMTLYLWHLPVLGLIIGLSALCGLQRDPHALLFWPTVLATTACLLALMIPVTGVLSVLENRPLPWWDAQIVGGWSTRRDALIVALLVVVGVATLLLAGSGIVAGWSWLVIGVAAAMGARSLGRAPASSRRC